MGEKANVKSLVQRNSTWYLRKRVPKELVAVIGKREIWRSLKTKNQRQALRLLPNIAEELQTQFDIHQQNDGMSELPPCAAATDPDLNKLYREKFAAVRANELAMRERVLRCLGSN